VPGARASRHTPCCYWSRARKQPRLGSVHPVQGPHRPHAAQRAMPFLGRGVAAARAATRGCASAAALDLLERLCAPDAAQRLLPSQALYLPALD